MATRIVVDNRAALRAKFENQSEVAVAKAAHDVEARAKVGAPVFTGFLRNSIKAERIGKMRWRVFVGAQYGIFVELGTRFKAACPFLLPALYAVRASLVRALKALGSR